MFSRATKVRFDANKFKHLSTNRLIRMPNEKVSSSGKRTCLLFSVGFFFVGVAFLRESTVHRRNYVPAAIGYGRVMDDPWIAATRQGSFKGYKSA